jgi:hypothetical protein
LLMDAIRFGETVFETASITGAITTPRRRSTKNTQ